MLDFVLVYTHAKEMNGGEHKAGLPHLPVLLLAIKMATPRYRRRGVIYPSLTPFEITYDRSSAERDVNALTAL